MATPPAWLPIHHAPQSGEALRRVSEAAQQGQLGGGGHWTHQCEQWLQQHTGAHRAFLTGSCSQALVMAALLLDLSPGDEVIMPAWTFPSAASAFLLCGARPVFVDVCDATLNIDPMQVRKAIGPRTRAVCITHYAGMAADMDALMALADDHGLWLVEDAAQGLLSMHRERHLGTMGHLGTLSFHHSKCVGAGEAGALLVNDPALVVQAEILREKGTDRCAFERGEVPAYRWQRASPGGGPSELVAAYLSGQLTLAREWQQSRHALWRRYMQALPSLSTHVQLLEPLQCAQGNASCLAIRVPADDPASVRAALAEQNIEALPHYQPLHLSPAGRHCRLAEHSLPVTEAAAGRVLRLPLHTAMTDADVDRVVAALQEAVR